jgi:hypothetical protein
MNEETLSPDSTASKHLDTACEMVDGVRLLAESAIKTNTISSETASTLRVVVAILDGIEKELNAALSEFT